MKVEIQALKHDHIDALTALAMQLWPEGDVEQEKRVCTGLLDSDANACFLARHAGVFIAFIHVSLRHEHVEGAGSSPVGYVEGIYVQPAFRKKGVGRMLLRAGEDWCKMKGCTEMASDTECHNAGSIDFHRVAGFREVSRIVCFVKNVK